MTEQNNTAIDQQEGRFWPMISCDFGMEALIAMHVLTMLIAVPGNLLTIIVITRNKSLLDESAYLLICSVSVADFLVSLVSQPLNIAVLLIGVNKIGNELNLTLFFCVWGFCGASAFGVVFITIDRFVYIMYPMHYTSILSRKRTYIMITLQWVAGLAYGLFPMINIEKSIFPTAAASLVTLCAMTACMTLAYNQVHRNIKRINQAETKRSASKRKQNNATITIAFIVLVFFICWFPYIVTNFINAAGNYDSNSSIRALYYWFTGLGCWNSAFNVFIYGFKNSTLKYEAKKLLKLQRGVEPEFSSKTKDNLKRVNGQYDPRKSNLERQAIGSLTNQNAYSTFQDTAAVTSPFKKLQAGVKSLLGSRHPNSITSLRGKNEPCILESFSNNSVNSVKSFESDHSNGTGYTDNTSLHTFSLDTAHSRKLKFDKLKPGGMKSSESMPNIRKLIIEEEHHTAVRRLSIRSLNIPSYTNLAFESEEEETTGTDKGNHVLEIIVHPLISQVEGGHLPSQSNKNEELTVSVTETKLLNQNNNSLMVPPDSKDVAIIENILVREENIANSDTTRFVTTKHTIHTQMVTNPGETKEEIYIEEKDTQL